jgi:hypothetical protein
MYWLCRSLTLRDFDTVQSSPYMYSNACHPLAKAVTSGKQSSDRTSSTRVTRSKRDNQLGNHVVRSSVSPGSQPTNQSTDRPTNQPTNQPTSNTNCIACDSDPLCLTSTCLCNYATLNSPATPCNITSVSTLPSASPSVLPGFLDVRNPATVGIALLLPDTGLSHTPWRLSSRPPSGTSSPLKPR